MSVFCPKCQSKTYNEWKCDMCQYQIKEEVSKKNKIKFNFNPMIAIPLIVISFGISYLAYDKYQERKLIKNLMGTNDPDKMMEGYKNSIKKISGMTDKQLKSFKMLNVPISTKN